MGKWLDDETLKKIACPGRRPSTARVWRRCCASPPMRGSQIERSVAARRNEMVVGTVPYNPRVGWQNPLDHLSHSLATPVWSDIELSLRN